MLVLNHVSWLVGVGLGLVLESGCSCRFSYQNVLHLVLTLLMKLSVCFISFLR